LSLSPFYVENPAKGGGDRGRGEKTMVVAGYLTLPHDLVEGEGALGPANTPKGA